MERRIPRISGQCIAQRCPADAEYGLRVVPLCWTHWLEMEYMFSLHHQRRAARAEQRAAEAERRRDKEAESEVYYLRRPRDGQIKIGFSVEIPKRMGALREGHGEVVLLAKEQGGLQKERRRHKQFAHLRREGEWFEPADDLLDHINSLSLGVLVP